MKRFLFCALQLLSSCAWADRGDILESRITSSITHREAIDNRMAQSLGTAPASVKPVPAAESDANYTNSRGVQLASKLRKKHFKIRH